MAISTLDGLVAALPGQQNNGFKTGGTISAAGQFYFAGVVGGQPAALATPAALSANGTLYDNTSVGAWPFTNPAAQGNLARVMASAPAITTVLLYDLLWAATWTATTTGAQAVTFPTVPSRDVNGAANGDGVELWYLPWATIGAAAGTITVTYTNKAGVAGRVTSALTPVTAGVTGRAQQFTLQAGDIGVRSVQSVNSSATMTSGTPAIAMIRRLATIPLFTANKGEVLDWAQLGFPRVYAGTCLQAMALCTATTALSPLMLETNVTDG